MKFSYSWLNDFVNLSNISPQALADKLTNYAFEVEEVSTYGANIVGPIIAGKILEINPHPNADKIRLTKVQITDTEIRDIVCGAWNIEVGNVVPVALPGALVLNRHDNSVLPIKKSKIRGQTSDGMLCSPAELGLNNNDSNGIYILDNFYPGQNLIENLYLNQDFILHIEPRSNRPDALSHFGMAREIAAIYDLPLIEPQTNLDKFKQHYENFLKLNIIIENFDDCPYFLLVALKNFKTLPSPLKIQRRLESIGVRSINFIVDITNYVLHEMGQPMHAYDYNKLNQNNNFIVRKALPNEIITAIDNREKILDSTNLIIANDNLPLSIAGIMGGKDSEISDTTNTIVLESATFNAKTIRHSSRKLGLSSDSSLRFERGVIKAYNLNSLQRALYLILNYGLTQNPDLKYSAVFAQGNSENDLIELTVSPSKINNTLGLALTIDQISNMLMRLGFKIVSTANNELVVTPPNYRLKDITSPIDVIEEIARLYGYENIPLNKADSIDSLPLNTNISNMAKSVLVGYGFNEIWTSSLIPKDSSANNIRVLNPISQDHEVLRESLIPGLIEVFKYNLDRQYKDIWIFENAFTYTIKDNNNNSTQSLNPKRTNVQETRMLSALIYGNNENSNWLAHTKELDYSTYFRLKGILENVLASLGMDLNLITYEIINHPQLHPGRSAKFAYNANVKTDIGIIGEFHPQLNNKFNLKNRASLFELDLNKCEQFKTKAKFKPIAVTPVVSRDITIDVLKNLLQQDLKSAIINYADSKLINCELTSRYQLNENTTSLTYRLNFQDPQATLTSIEIDSYIDLIKLNLSKNYQVSFR